MTEAFKNGELRNVSILFSDMKGFTPLSQKLSPEEMDALMTSIFSDFETIVRKYEGTVEKYIGDAIVAVFGVPRVHEDDASRAIHAAMDFLELLGQKSKDLPVASLGFRTGIHTGLIATGQRGDFKVVTGHAMSVASRLEAAADMNTVLISEATKEKVEGEFIFSEQRRLKLKGKDEVVHAYTILGRKNQLLTYSTPFVGRKDELNRILKDYFRSDPENINGFIVYGEAGIGKSRLCLEFLKRIRQFPDFQSPVLYARARRFRANSFTLVRDLLFDFLDLPNNASVVDIEKSLIAKLPAFKEADSRLSSFLLGDIDFEQEKNMESTMLLMFTQFFEAIASQFKDAPYIPVLFIDNIQYADAQSINFIRFFSRQAKYKPYFIFSGRQRPKESEGFKDFWTFELERFKRAEARELVQALLADQSISDAMFDKVIVNSSGNPLFIEEFIKYLKENKTDSDLPMTIQNIFLSATEGYSPIIQEFLKKLSVFMRSFSLENAAYIHIHTGGDEKFVEPVLTFFIREDILYFEKEQYYFRHDLFRKTLYNSMLEHNRRILHGLVVDSISIVDSKEKHSRLRILHHLIFAHRFDEAFELLQNNANATSHASYAKYLKILLEKVDDEDKKLRLMFSLAANHFNTGNLDESETVLNDIIIHALTKKRTDFLGAAYHLLAAFHMKAFNWSKMDFCGEQALRYFCCIGETPSNIQNVLKLLCLSAKNQNKLERAEEILSQMKKKDPEESLSDYVSSIAELSLYKGNYLEALDILTKALLKTKRELKMRWTQGYMLLLRIYNRMCNYSELEHVTSELIESAVLSEDDLCLLFSLRAKAAAVNKQVREADTYLNQAEYYYNHVQNEFGKMQLSYPLAEAHMLNGNTEMAESLAKSATLVALRNSCNPLLFNLLVMLTELAFVNGSHADALFFLSEAQASYLAGQYNDAQTHMLYHFFRGKLLTDIDREAELLEAKTLLETELTRLNDASLEKNLLKTRSLRKILNEKSAYEEVS